MATSGTIGATTVKVAQIIEQAARACRVAPSTLTADNIESANTNLFLLLSDLANRGISLWCVQAQLVALAARQSSYPLLPGTVDVLNALFRTQSYVTGTDSAPTALIRQTQFATTTRVDTVGVDATAAGTATLAIESSQDGIAWTTALLPPAFAAVVGGRYWFDVDPAMNAPYMRVRETVAAALGFAAPLWATSPYEIAMGVVSRDVYTALPNKEFGSGRPLQYWFDKQLAPRLVVWPVPTDSTTLLTVWAQRHIQDVGSMTNELAIPQRWLNSVVMSLAHKTALELPEVPLPHVEYLEGQAEKHLRRAEDGETDGAPVRISPALRHYTRG